MSATDYQRVRDLFSAARKLAGEERQRLLDSACGDDAVLRAEVESLLANFDAPSGRARILDGAAAGSAVLRGLIDGPPIEVPARIGQYRVVRVIGEGAMGIVYEAEQDNPRRRVALKVMRPGLFSRQVLPRFEREAQILGRLHHPGIAQVYEAGTFGGTGEAGTPRSVQPFFAMELIEGVPLSRYVTDRHLGVRERLMLMARICDAVQHAHDRGVIHRDLKPANIMVVEDGESGGGAQPKVLDFGVARAADPDLRMTTIQTGMGQLIGTVAYMSPEQARGESEGLDARSDVYALGVMLYELLADRLPYDVGGRMVHDAVRVIQDAEPERLSSIDRVFRGDVETIVAKSLEKDRDRRYPSAGAIAADIRRFLADQPIVARPATRTYQLKKFARRNKVLVGGVAATFLALIVGMIASTAMYLRAERARRGEAEQTKLATTRAEEADAAQKVAKAEAKKVGAINTFLLKRMVKSPDPRMQGRDIKVIEVLDQAAKEVGTAFPDAPDVECDTRIALAECYSGLGEFKQAMEQAQAAYELAVKSAPPESDRITQGVLTIGRCYMNQDRADEAAKWLIKAKERLGPRADSDEDLALDVMGTLADAIQHDNRPAEAEPILRRVLAARERVKDTDPDDMVYNLNILGASLIAQNKIAEAEPVERRMYEQAKKSFGADHPTTLMGLQNLAALLVRQKKPAEAEPFFRELVPIVDKVMGHDNVNAGVTRINLADCLEKQKKFEEADNYYEQAIPIIRGAVGNVYLTERSMFLYYDGLMSRGLFARAEPIIRERLNMRKERGVEHEEVQLEVLKHHVTTLNRTAMCTEALPEAEQAVALAKELYKDAGDPRVARAQSWYGETLVCLKRYAEAEPLLLASYAAQEHAQGVAGRDAPLTAATLSQMYDRMGRGDEAQRWGKIAGP